MTGTYALVGSQIVQTNQNGWVYYFFDLIARRSGTTNQDLNVSTTTTSASAGGTMNWTARGMRLPPRLTGAASEGIVGFQLLVDDSSTGPIVPASSSAQVQLDPNVILVPIVVEQLYADDQVAPNGWYPPDRAVELFDNQWLMDRHTTTNPGASPYQITSSWITEQNTSTGSRYSRQGTGTQDGTLSGIAREPDAIWTQCNIQFRLVRYVPCKVTPDQWQNTQPTYSAAACAGGQQANRVLKGADTPACQKEALVAGTLRVILSGPFEDLASQCSTITLGQTAPNDSNVLVSTLGLNTFNVVAHELGHALGLYHDTVNPNALMTPTGGLTTELDSSSCATARARALQLQSAYTGSW